MSRAITALHVSPGRTRLKIPGLYGSAALKQSLESRLCAVAGVYDARANPLTGNLLVLHAPETLAPAIADAVQCGLNGAEIPDPAGAAVADDPPSTAVAVRPGFTEEVETVEAQLASSRVRGLSEAESAERLARYGQNALPRTPARSELEMLAKQFLSTPMALLGASAAVSVATGALLDAGVIGGVIAFNSLIGFFTERQAERTISALNGTAPRQAMVVRDGVPRRIAVEHLVRGDIVVLSPGSFVPADARLIESHRLSVDESMLTGESMPVTKQADFIAAETAPLGDRRNMVYMGTVVTGGGGRAMVVATGRNTEVGAIQAVAGETRPPLTPMESQLDQAGTRLALLSGVICLGVFGLGLLRGYGRLEMLKAALSLAVAAVPEGLPAVATTTLALGVKDMRRRHVAVRRLEAVETLGEVQVLCLDKTGTLTQNRMSVLAIHCDGRRLRLTPAGLFHDDAKVEPLGSDALSRLLQVVVLCSEAQVEGAAKAASSPTENALLETAMRAGIDVMALRRQYPRRRIHYRADRRPYMSTLHQTDQGEYLLAIKGSPAEVLAMCRWAIVDGERIALDEAQRELILRENARMAGQSLRVLAGAYKTAGDIGGADKSQDLTWLGLVGMADPLRPGMAKLMAEFHRAGIQTVMITGDQSATAYAIGKELKLNGDSLEILDSSSLARLDPELLAGLVRKVQVFARVSPVNKLQIVQALQRNGMIVAMTGDGINDGLALKAADIGVALGGAGGTEVARSLADVVLEEDQLDAMIVAVRQGRTIYGNVRKAIHFLLSTNLTEIEVMVAAIALGRGAALTPIQLLWINLITDIFPALALTMEPPEPDIMARPPRDPKESILGRQDFRRIGRESAVISGGALAAFGYGLWRYGAGVGANTVAFSALTLGQIIHALSCRSEVQGIFDAQKRPANPYLNTAVGASVALQIATLLVPGLRRFLGLQSIGVLDGLVVGAAAITPFLLNEAVKHGGRERTKTLFTTEDTEITEE